MQFDDLGELAALTDALGDPSASRNDDAGGDAPQGDRPEGGPGEAAEELDPVFARFAELMREREPEPEPEPERDDEPFTIWNGPDDDDVATADEATGPPARPAAPTPAVEEPMSVEEPLFSAAVSPSPSPSPSPEPEVGDADDEPTDLPDAPARGDDHVADDRSQDVDPTQDVGTGPPLAPLRDGWVGFTARSSPTPGKRRRR